MRLEIKNHQFALPPFALFIICSDLLYLFLYFFEGKGIHSLVEVTTSQIDEFLNSTCRWRERAVVLSCRRGSGLCQIIKQTLTEVERPHEKMILILGWREAEQQENWCQSILLCRLLITQTYQNPHHKASSPNRLEKNPSLLINNEKNQPVTTKYIFNAQDVHTLEIARCARAFT